MATPINERKYNEIPNQNQWLKATNECTWYGVECLGGDDVTDLVLGTLSLIHHPIIGHSCLFAARATLSKFVLFCF
jgi:hypothetical protein